MGEGGGGGPRPRPNNMAAGHLLSKIQHRFSPIQRLNTAFHLSTKRCRDFEKQDKLLFIHCWEMRWVCLTYLNLQKKNEARNDQKSSKVSID